MNRRSWFASLVAGIAWVLGVKPAEPEYIYAAIYRSDLGSIVLGWFASDAEATDAQLEHIFGPDKPTGTYCTLKVRMRRTGLAGFTYGRSCTTLRRG